MNAERLKAKRKAAWRRRRLVLLLMSPWLVGFTVFFGYPLVANVYFSFTHYDLLSSPRWIGFANYRFLFNGAAQIGTAVKNTIWLLLIAVPLQVLFAFGVATMLATAVATAVVVGNRAQRSALTSQLRAE
jgi:multiple sugar transport system permease protein